MTPNASSAVISKFDYCYDGQGQITSWTQQCDSNDPQNWAMQYDNSGQLINTTLTDTTTSTLMHQYAYSYDAAGNRTAEQIDGNVTSASYNSLNQLTGVATGGKMVFSGSVSKYATVTVGGNAALLDASNNFRGAASVTAGTNTVSVVATDVDGNTTTNHYQVVVASGGSSSNTYDANGNLTQDATRSYQWDAKNELTAIIYNSGPNAGSHTEFGYNGVGERVKIAEVSGATVGSGTVASTKQYVWVGGIAEERDSGNNVIKRYFGQGEQRIVSGTTTNYFYTRDQIGSIREMVGTDGTTIVARYSYDPFGRATQISGSISCDFQYAGMFEHGNSGLDLTPARAYDPNVGRFISRDPTGGLNLYAYCEGNPINYNDPLGLSKKNPQIYIVNDSDIDYQMNIVYKYIDSHPQTFSWTNSANYSSTGPFAQYMEGSADTQFVGYGYDQFVYQGTAYPALSGFPMTGHALNYLALGAGMAAAGLPEWVANIIVQSHFKNAYPGDSLGNALEAMDAGYNAYNNRASSNVGDKGSGSGGGDGTGGGGGGGGCIDGPPDDAGTGAGGDPNGGASTNDGTGLNTDEID